MKLPTPSLLVALLLGISIVPSTLAQFTTINDDFSTAGNLTGSTPDSGVGVWTTISSSPPLSVSSGVLNIAAGTGEASQLNFSSSNLSSETVYMGFDLVLDTQSIGTTSTASAIAGFRTGTPASGSYALGFSMFRPSSTAQSANSLPNTSTSQYDIGIFSGSSASMGTTGTIAGWAQAINMGTTVQRVVIGLNHSTETAYLWLNPTSIGSTSVTLTGITADTRGVFFRQGANSHGSSAIDNLIVSLDFDSAALTAVPEPSTYAAILGGVALVGVMVLRRRKSAANAA